MAMSTPLCVCTPRERRLVSVAETETQVKRVARSKEEAKVAYNRMSRWYDALAGGSERRIIYLGLQKLGTTEGQIVLEVGFGTGHGLLALAAAVGESGKVYGIDISDRMVDIARAGLRKAGLSGRVKVRQGDAATLPFEDHFFDAVFMSFTLELFDTPEIPLVLHECHRVLRAGGRICVVAMSKRGKGGFMVRLYEWAHDKFPVYLDCRPIFVRKTLNEAGFRAADVTDKSMWGLPVEIVVAESTLLEWEASTGLMDKEDQEG
jgi:ubiquinone/menaquinone biosynthesis C-methylase UbiE